MQKYTKIYRCPDDIENFKLRVKLKEAKATEETNDQTQETRTFRWQEKVYGKFERDFYKDEKNCITDLDKKYHNEIINLTESDDLIFSYVDDDAFSFGDSVCSNSKNVSELCRHVNNLSFRKYSDREGSPKEDTPKGDSPKGDGPKGDGRKGDYHKEDSMGKEYDFEQSLNEAVRDPFLQQFDETMFIVADFGEYYENTWLKSEYILAAIKYNRRNNILSIYPDFSGSEPYVLHVSNDVSKVYHYYVENVSENMSTEALTKETEILNKISTYKRKLQLQDFLSTFELPPKNMLDIHLLFEIQCAKNFEYDNIYVQYFIDLPEPWLCKHPETLKGYTHSCVTKTTKNLANFGFPFHVCLEYNLQNLQDVEIPKPPYIYFEVISKDSWNRYRTEGLTYKSLPISQPGVYDYDLPCFRLTPKNPIAKMRRFFIGDCSNYNDITWTGVPKDCQGPVVNKYGIDTIGTGEIHVKVNVIHQSQAFMSDGTNESLQNREKFLLEKLKSSHLIKSVEQVLEAFKRARRNMVEARKNV